MVKYGLSMWFGVVQIVERVRFGMVGRLVRKGTYRCVSWKSLAWGGLSHGLFGNGLVKGGLSSG